MRKPKFQKEDLVRVVRLPPGQDYDSGHVVGAQDLKLVGCSGTRFWLDHLDGVAGRVAAMPGERSKYIYVRFEGLACVPHERNHDGECHDADIVRACVQPLSLLEKLAYAAEVEDEEEAFL